MPSWKRLFPKRNFARIQMAVLIAIDEQGKMYKNRGKHAHEEICIVALDA